MESSITGKCWIIHGEAGGVKPIPLQELHPLLFPTVLNKVFGYMSVWNHKKCRLVCKSWEAALCPHLRLNVKVNLSKLVTYYSVSSSENEDQEEMGRKWEEATTIFKGLGNICNSFVIEEDPIIIKSLQKQTLLPLQIKYLEIKHFKWNLSQIIKILRELPLLEELRLPILCSSIEDENEGLENHSPKPNKKCPHINKYISKSAISNWNKPTECVPIIEEFVKLKRIIVTLTIRDLQFFDYKSTSVQPILKLLQLTPNLNEVYYPNVIQFSSPFDNPARVLLETIINNSHFLCKLSVLKIDTFLSNADLKILTLKKLSFKSLQLTVTPEIQCQVLYEFFKVSEPTLTQLTLTFRDGFQFNSQFPSLSHLQTMALILWNGGLDFIQEIKKMKILIIVLMEMKQELFQKLKYHNFSSQSNLQELEIHANQNSKAELASTLLTMMPQSTLKKLTLDWVNDSQLQTIYKSLPHLQELTILYGGFSTSGITGIPTTFCRDEYCCDDNNSQEFYVLGLKRRLGIGDMKNLKYLCLNGDLTDFLLIFGVFQCSTLQGLELSARSCSKVTDISIKKIADGRNKMSQTLQVLRLKNFLGLISNEAVNYLKTKFNGREIHLC